MLLNEYLHPSLTMVLFDRSLNGLDRMRFGIRHLLSQVYRVSAAKTSIGCFLRKMFR